MTRGNRVTVEMCFGRCYICGNRKFMRYKPDGKTLEQYDVTEEEARFLLNIKTKEGTPYFRIALDPEEAEGPVTEAGVVPESMRAGMKPLVEEDEGPDFEKLIAERGGHTGDPLGENEKTHEAAEEAKPKKKTRTFKRKTKGEEPEPEGDGDNGDEV